MLGGAISSEQNQRACKNPVCVLAFIGLMFPLTVVFQVAPAESQDD